MASAHVQVEKFENGDIEYFLEHFEICSLANEWTVEKKALMIATCLRGEALEVYKTLDVESRLDFETVKAKLLSAFKPEDTKFTSLSEFQNRSLHPGETPQKYLYELKGLLRKAFPDMSIEAKEQLIFEQYIRGFPRKIYESIRLSPEIKTSDQAMKRAQVLLRLESESLTHTEGTVVSVIKSKHGLDSDENLNIRTLNESIKLITKRLDDLDCNDNENRICSVGIRRTNWRTNSIRREGYRGQGTLRRGPERSYFKRESGEREVICYVCGGRGHIAQDCDQRAERNIRCYNCSKFGHRMTNCPRPPFGNPLN